jgi:DNA-binding CsgD family transcriptional regulator
MALHLGLSPLTIDAYVRSIRRKMGVRSRVEAVAVGIAAGIVHVDAPYRRSSDSA